jgi:DNA polymerase III subunit epsilon
MLLPEFLPDGLAFVDIETTGGPAQRESITEIGIVEVTEDGVREWSTLVRPAMRIAPHIERLTGISNDMVADAPPFAEVAEAVFDRLESRLFVAHNARFDHGYLRAAFRRTGMDLPPRMLCTVRLSRRLFPEQRRHGLDQLIERHGLQVAARHRALDDARALWQFWQQLHAQFAPRQIEEAVRHIIGRPTLPPHLDPADIECMPERPGVYLFHGENDLPLYIGKSRRLRSRVLAHFCADHASDRELSLCQQTRRIAWLETEGELGALLKEAELIKTLQPTHNRRLRRNRELCAWRAATDLVGDWQLELVHASDLDFGSGAPLYGFFRNRRDALNRLRALAQEHALCPPLLGLEPRPAGGRCFTHQLHRCHGACLGEEALQDHAQRLLQALQDLKVEGWPFDGPVILREGGALHLVDNWRYLGRATDAAGVRMLLANGRPLFDRDIHQILRRHMHLAEPLQAAGLAPE